MTIRFFDMFAGVGGFRSGLEAAGGFACAGHCEIDKYANQAYNAIYEPEGELYFEDARTINPNELPDIDLICAGFPCQSFSIADLAAMIAGQFGQLAPMDEETADLFQLLAKKMITKTERM
ncbi:DNA cytosine methyltransferase [Hydrogeniiclostridium mannosilyticum]|uniref:DNA cytosine methyltransferase n=1 Tax=Hydrogeniiclostridium mannosilyticum TaxID=2764322 RepID=UPI0018AACF31|nr:DNA cytosine methyltransferase [Hydrogeniiclostridium mannosilyticum]